jgi:hypothetical protein
VFCFALQLNEGQPITVVAIGTSVTAEYGGCFFAGPYQELLSRVSPGWGWVRPGEPGAADTNAASCSHDWQV